VYREQRLLSVSSFPFLSTFVNRWSSFYVSKDIQFNIFTAFCFLSYAAPQRNCEIFIRQWNAEQYALVALPPVYNIQEAGSAPRSVLIAVMMK
jgi:hypothetical protein